MSPKVLADIVKAYDVRGLVPEQLDARVATALGSAFAQVVAIPEGEDGVMIGHDMRDSSPELARAFADGVTAHGLDVTMIGLCSTDVLYYASGAEQRAGAMFTASHNPAGYNGIKLCRRGARPVGQDSGLTEIRDLAQWLLDRGAQHDLPTSGRTGAVTETDMLAGYAAYLHSLVRLDDIRPLRVVVDAGSGMAGLTVPIVLGMDGLPITVEPLYFELDGTFPHHEANPLEPENLRDLQAAVREHGADLGLAFDGDADRCFVIDERGEPVSPSAVTALVAAREITRAVDAGTDPSEVAVVHNTICSRAVPETIHEHGARAVRSRVGHSFIKAQMAEHGAVFGGEHSAHYYFKDFWFADTGMLAAMHLLAALGEQEGPLSELVAAYDRYVASGELNSRVPDVSAATERVREWAAAQGASEDRLDGLSMVHEDPYWSFSLRPSNTEPLLRLNVEAQDRAVMEDIRDSVLTLVRQER
ncbi:phosphomannomutase/phosphoglucomutase [Ornithinimicrobium sufpigmenti]|uniref:phosphomannomutase/phosphoglucomutase n=1 Tax=Ornithinimicrobium sufpigmenti TaxID=2508882 RepID=UPI001036BD0E|nr:MULTISPECIES: phosphomannomutase/phosphoglucomutase [unclassified Ornithinimicrobium]